MVVLAIAAAWLGGQLRTINALERGSSLLREQIATSRAADT